MDTTVAPPPIPTVNRLTYDDVKAALRAGLTDFGRAPAFGLFFGGVFTAFGAVVFLSLMVWGVGLGVLPLAFGFPLLGPFLALGLYEVSRRLEAGEPLDWAAVLSVLSRHRSGQIPMMMFVCIFFFLVWVWLAHLIYMFVFGFRLTTMTNVMSSAETLLTTEGILMLLMGSAVGGVIAFLLYAITVVSLPMLLERDLDFVTAMIVSFRAVTENPGPMLLYGVIVGVATLLAMLPIFLGVLLVFPVLGHASWALYRRAIASE